MTEIWPELIPAAMLSQRTLDVVKTIGGAKYATREVYSGAQNWCIRERVEAERHIPCTIIAHAHIKDGCKSKDRDGVWSKILSPVQDIEALHAAGMRVYGRGWEAFSGYKRTPQLFCGETTPPAVDALLAQSYCGPMVSIVDGFYTGKLRTYLQQGCCPLLYGRGQPFTYDPEERFLGLNDYSRVSQPGDLKRAVDVYGRDTEERAHLVEYLTNATQPDFTMVRGMLNDLISGADVRSDAWFNKYGGYRKLG